MAAKGKQPTLPAVQRLSYWLPRTCRELRKGAGIARRRVAEIADVDVATIVKWEKGQSLPKESDRYLAAYAIALGIEDGRLIAVKAVERWQEPPGQAPSVDGAPLTRHPPELRQRGRDETLAELDRLLREEQAARETRERRRAQAGSGS